MWILERYERYWKIEGYFWGNLFEVICSVQFSCSVVSDSLQPHGLQHTRLPCPSPPPGDCSNSCPSSRWCHVILCHPLLLPPSIFPSIRGFSSESVHRIRWPEYWSFIFSISPSNEYSGLISFRMDWLGLLAGQGTLKSLLQHHSSKASILWCSVFFIVQLSHPYLTTGKAITLTRWIFVSKITSLLFNMMSRLVIPLLPRSKHLLISWLQLPSAVILEPQEIKSDTVSIVSPSFALNCWEQMPRYSFFECWILIQLFHSRLSVSSIVSLIPLCFLP